MKLLPVRSTEPKKLPWPPNSIYKFSSENRYPSIIIRIDGKLFVDMDAFEDMAREKRDTQIAKAKAARRGLDE